MANRTYAIIGTGAVGGYFGARLHHGLTRDLEDLARSGRGWARRALDPETSAGRIYVSAAGFTDRFRSVADDEETASRLIDLEDLYRDREG